MKNHTVICIDMYKDYTITIMPWYHYTNIDTLFICFTPSKARYASSQQLRDSNINPSTPPLYSANDSFSYVSTQNFLPVNLKHRLGQVTIP